MLIMQFNYVRPHISARNIDKTETNISANISLSETEAKEKEENTNSEHSVYSWRCSTGLCIIQWYNT